MVKSVATKTGYLFMALETAVLTGHEIARDAGNAVMKDDGVKLDDVAYARFFLDRDLTAALRALSAFYGLTLSDDTADKFQQAVTERMLAETKIHPAAESLLSVAVKDGATICAVTRLSADQASVVLANLKLTDAFSHVHCCEPAGGPWTISRDEWRKGLAAVGAPAALSLAAVGSSRNCRSALDARMQCAALTSPMVEAQDFGGAHFVGASMSAEQAQTLMQRILV